MKIKLSEISIAKLNAQSVILFTQYVRLARVREGADLKMQYPDIVKLVAQHASTTQNPDLIVLFMRIKNELAKHITKANLEKPSFNIYADVA